MNEIALTSDLLDIETRVKVCLKKTPTYSEEQDLKKLLRDLIYLTALNIGRKSHIMLGTEDIELVKYLGLED